MKVERFDPGMDSASVRACHDIYLSGLPDDDPLGPPMTPRVFAGWLALGWTEDPLETWLARDDSGEPCGWYALNLPQRENRQLAGLSLAVHARLRRAGRGTALLRHAAGQARQAGRTVLEMDALEGSPGAAFAGTLKARPSLTAVQRVLALADLPAGRRAALRGKLSLRLSDTPWRPGKVRRPGTWLTRSLSSTGRWPTRPGRPGRRRRPGMRPGSGWTSAGSRRWDCGLTWSRRARRARATWPG